MKKIQKNYELNAGESFRLDKNGLHGVTAQGYRLFYQLYFRY